jgi:hypothetical protein
MFKTEVTELEVKINKHKNKNTFTHGIHKITAANYWNCGQLTTGELIVDLERLIVWLLSKSSTWYRVCILMIHVNEYL